MTENQLQKSCVNALDILWHVACHSQTRPNGKNCFICGDNDHQAFECRHNLLRKKLRLSKFQKGA